MATKVSMGLVLGSASVKKEEAGNSPICFERNDSSQGLQTGRLPGMETTMDTET